MCKEFTESSGARYGSLGVGTLFVMLGALILFLPNFLVWLAGISTMLLGLMVFAGGFAVRPIRRTSLVLRIWLGLASAVSAVMRGGAKNAPSRLRSTPWLRPHVVSLFSSVSSPADVGA